MHRTARILILMPLLAQLAGGSQHQHNADTISDHLQSVKVLDASAGIFMYEHFLSSGECDHLIALAEPRMTRSAVVTTTSNGTGEGVTHAVRTSSGAAFKRGEDDIVKEIEERIARFSLLPVSHQENMQVLRYEPGQQYRPHWDFFQDNSTVQNGGNRHTTLVVYLNDVEEGGETLFPLLPAATDQQSDTLSECARKGLSIKPKKGTALLWHNLTPEGNLEPRSLHAGCPVHTGVKYALAKWIRSRPYMTMEDAMMHIADQEAQLVQVARMLAVATAR